jgi:hypothetical protein
LAAAFIEMTTEGELQACTARRLCDPYVTWPLLEKHLGEQLATEVACRYFTEHHGHRYSFRPQFARCLLTDPPQSAQWQRRVTMHRADRVPTCCVLPAPSELAIAAIKPRPGLPDELTDEVDSTRKTLLKLRQNVVLLQDAEDSNRFYPVGISAGSFSREPGQPLAAICCHLMGAPGCNAAHRAHELV